MSVMMESLTTHPLERRTTAHQKMPQLKKPLGPTSFDKLKTQKTTIRDSGMLFKLLRETFDLAPSTSPADAVCKLSQKMSVTEDKNSKLQEQIRDHDVLLFAIQDALDLGPEVGPVRVTRTFNKHFRTTKDLSTRLASAKKTIKDIAGSIDVAVAGKKIPDIIDGIEVAFNALKADNKALQTKNEDLAIGLKEAQNERHIADNLVAALEIKVSDLEATNDKQTNELGLHQDLFEQYEQAGDAAERLKTELDAIKVENDALVAKIEALETSKEQVTAKHQAVKVAAIEQEQQDAAKDQAEGAAAADQEPQVAVTDQVEKVVDTIIQREIDDITSEFKVLLDSKKTEQTNEGPVKTVNDLQEEVDALVTTSVMMVSDLTDAQRQISDLEDKVHELQTVNDVQACELETLAPKDQDVSRLEDYVADLQLEKNELNARLKESKTELTQYRQTHDTLTAQIKGEEREAMLCRYEDDLRQLVSEKETLTYNVTTLITKRRESLAQMQQCLNETAASRRYAEELTTKIQTLHKEKEELVFHLESMINQCELSTLKVQQCATQTGALEILTAELTEQLKKTQTDRASSYEDPDLKSAEECLFAELQDVKEKLTNAAKEKEDLIDESVLMKTQLDDVFKKLDDALQKHRDLGDKLQISAHEKEELEDDNHQLVAKLDKVSKELDDALQEHRDMDKGLKITSQEKEDLEDESIELQTKLQDVWKDLDNARREKQELREQMKLTTQQKKLLEDQTVQLKTRLDNVSEERDRIRQENLDMDENVKLSSRQHEDLEQENNRLNIKLDDVTKDLVEIQQEFKKTQSVQEATSATAQILERQMTEIQCEKEQLKKRFEGVEQDRMELQAKVNELNSRLETTIPEKQKLEYKNNSLIKELRDVVVILEQAVNQKEALEERVDKLKNDLIEITSELHETQKEHQETVEKCNVALAALEDKEALVDELQKENKTAEFQKKLFEKKVASALSLADDYKADIANMKVETRGLKNQLDFRQRKIEELQEKLSEVKELSEGLETKATDLEAQNQELAHEFQKMKDSLHKATAQFGLLSEAGDKLNIVDLCQAFEDMKHRCANMTMEVEDLKKTRATFDQMLALDTSIIENGEWSESQSATEKKISDLKEQVEDLRFKTFKQERLIRGLRYNMSLYQKTVLQEKDSMFNDMNYVDRAVVDKLGLNIDIPVIPVDDIVPWDGQDIDGNNHQIGKGSFGEVFLRKFQDQAVAVKVPYINGDQRDPTEEQMTQIRANHARTTMEALVHLALAAKHQSFPKLHGIVDLEGVPSLVLEFLGDKKTGEVYSLSQVMRFQIPELSRENWLEIAVDIIHGIKAIHEQRLLHNDIKANNILLQFDKEVGRWRAYITDMGKVSTFAMPVKQTKMPKLEIEGYKDGVLHQHLAPEYILDLEPTSVHTDIYSLGRLLSRIEVFIRNSSLRELTASMMQKRPCLRPSWKKIERAISKARNPK